MTTVFERPSGAGTPNKREVQLPGGDLSLTIHRSELPFDELCGFGARRNPRRGFLFVSRVLGRHLPTPPSVMRDVYRRLAEKVPADLPGPVLVIAMAEMAICLGQGVYEELLKISGRSDLLFCHSTRFRVNSPLALDFEEEHSHASSHMVHRPSDPELAKRFATAGSLILVDDEMSTGSTFVNLARAMVRVNPALQQVITIVITDWTGPERQKALREKMPVEHCTVSLMDGEYEYLADPNAPAAEMPNVTGNGKDKSALLPANYGRLGIAGVPEVPERILRSATARAGERTLVIGTGEFGYLPFRLAEHLAAEGAEVYCQSTTRSPVMVSNAVTSVRTFQDNYEDGIPNFLYNLPDNEYDRIYLCYETPARTVQSDLVESLGAKVLLFNNG